MSFDQRGLSRDANGILTIDCDTMFAPTSRPVAIAASGKVANESNTSLKKTNVCPDNQLAVINEKDH